jgi:hypothetical protein
VDVIVVILILETLVDGAICWAIPTGVPPEGNIIGWSGEQKILLETKLATDNQIARRQ